MKSRYSILLATGLIFGAGAPAALAGPCAQQLTDIRKLMSAHDAGAGPVANTTAQAGQGTTDQKSTAVGQQGAGNTASGQAMTDATKLKAASDQDARRQQEGQPTASQQANGASSSGSNDRQGRIDEAVKQATLLDNKNDGGCQTKVQEAQRLLENHQTQ